MPASRDAELQDGIGGSGVPRPDPTAHRLSVGVHSATARLRRQNRTLAFLLAVVAAGALLAVVGLAVILHDAAGTMAAQSANRATSIHP
jgi:NADPH-dependent glutamate synthase beta subunit-like oxidoreductase